MKYNIVRFYKDPNRDPMIIRERVTLDEAQAHCKDPETSSTTCQKVENKARTVRVGDWFEGYQEAR